MRELTIGDMRGKWTAALECAAPILWLLVVAKVIRLLFVEGFG